MSSTVSQIGLLNTGSSLASSLAVSGLASGMDWSNVVTALANAERAPETLWKQQQTILGNQNSDFTTIKNYLASLQNDLKSLQDTSLYSSRSAQSSDSTIATASANPATNTGTFSFSISQLATAAKINGTPGVNAPLSANGDLSQVTVGTAGFASPVTAGTFTIYGIPVTITTTESLADVFQAISDATNGEVTASYDSTAGDANFDRITLTDHSGNNLVLGNTTDTSNFLQAARLYNGATPAASITSAAALGSVRLTAPMADADLQTTITNGDGNTGDGAFVINGVTINYNANTDSIQNVLDRINSSTTGVTVTFDSQNNRFLLTNNNTGNVGITLQDVAGRGNFLQATALSTGTFVAGQNLLYTLNGGSQQFTSLSNTITGDSSGLNGLSVTALTTGNVSVTVGTDTSKISSAIQQFIADYNNVQDYIASQTIVTTASDGTVTPGTLTGDMTTSNLVSNLRQRMFSSASSNPIGILSNLGVTSNGQTNAVTLDTNALANVLQNNLSAVQSFFTDPTNGLATQLNTYLDNTIGDSGTLTQHQADLTTQSNEISTQISNLETKIKSDSAFWTNEFQAMEQAQAKVNQELTYLSQQVSNGSL